MTVPGAASRAAAVGDRTVRDSGPRGGGPGVATMLAAQVRHAATDLWRQRVVAIFTFAIPMIWLVVIGVVAGNEAVDETTGVRVMQFVTPTAVAMGVIYAAFPTVAISLVDARESGVLKRVRGTPMPPWVYLAGRVGGAAVFALAAVAAMLVLGVVAYDVQLFARTLPAFVATITLGIVAFASIGTAVAALAPTTAVAQAASIGSAVVLSFLSEMFTFGGTSPAWMETTGDVLPLKPFAQALQSQLDPYATGAGWEPRRLAVVAAWGAAAALVAVLRFRWLPFAGRAGGSARPAGAVEAPATSGTHGRPDAREPSRDAPEPAGSQAAAGLVAGETGRPSALSLVAAQARAANRSIWRDAGAVFFGIAMPVGVYVFMVGSQPDGVVDGVPLAVLVAAGMITWGVAVSAFMNVPEAVAAARDKGALKRLRGTPLRPWQYMAGRTGVTLWLSLVIAVLVLAAAVTLHGVELTAPGVAVGVAVLLVGTLSLAACGFALASLVPEARAVGPVALVILLPLAFLSDIFFVGGPAWMGTVGGLFPLKHLQNALVAAWDPAGATLAWEHLAVLALWLVVAGLVAVRRFRWTAAGDR
ncbi:ABC transporter permease [Actinotalea subterranea]|uniref:ABC transporter permease n=1 Tax=Actinotalea subterranea TaxID=2607497 RepID=UPI0011F014FF|nr:ABC transporter permease [Actinotalea subterranea]